MVPAPPPPWKPAPVPPPPPPPPPLCSAAAAAEPGSQRARPDSRPAAPPSPARARACADAPPARAPAAERACADAGARMDGAGAGLARRGGGRRRGGAELPLPTRPGPVSPGTHQLLPGASGLCWTNPSRSVWVSFPRHSACLHRRRSGAALQPRAH